MTIQWESGESIQHLMLTEGGLLLRKKCPMDSSPLDQRVVAVLFIFASVIPPDHLQVRVMTRLKDLRLY